PLSYAQRRLWFLEQLAPGSPNYNVPLAVHVRGPLDVGRLRRTFDRLLERHEVLRASFHDLDGRPTQRVAPALSLPLEVESLEGLPAEARLGAAREAAAEEAGRPFDLTRAPLLRARVLRLSESEHVVALVMHHIVSDGWSLGVLVKELGALYAAFARGEESPLEELPIQYADYAEWQREVLAGEEMGRQLAYWRERLSGAEMLELPAERARPAAQSFRGAQHHFALPRELSEALGVLARREDATLFMVLLAAFQALLHRYTRQSDIVVGTPIAGRNRAEVENLIGFFVNTLVLRTDLSGDPSFRELLRRVREVTLGAFEHQDVPFEKLVEELRPERDPSHQPLFQAMLVLQNTPQEGVGFGDLRLSRLALESNVAKFDLTLGLEEGGDGLIGAFEYNTELFEAATVADLARHFERLLRAAVASPERPLSTLEMLDDEERRRLLSEWNDTARGLQLSRCVHELVEAQAERRPGALAVACGGTRLTYGELNRRANRLAHYLRGRG
ncbi:MAG TPA: condensation domain-containing protein, partial [Pyrinomonadaceae bacterium]